MGSRNLWTRLSFALLFTIVMQTMARPNPWFGEIFDKPQDSKKGETNIEMKRPNSRMIDERDTSSSSRFWDDLAPVFPRHLVQAFSGALRLCDILRWDNLAWLFDIDTSEREYKATIRAGCCCYTFYSQVCGRDFCLLAISIFSCLQNWPISGF